MECAGVLSNLSSSDIYTISRSEPDILFTHDEYRQFYSSKRRFSEIGAKWKSKPSSGNTNCGPLDVATPGPSNEPPLPDQTTTQKRTEYLSWDEYFMAVAFLASKCSKDPHTKVGACIVTEDKKIIGIGYNSMPKRAHLRHSLSWKRLGHPDPKKEGKKWLITKYPYVCYAAKNAVLNSNRADLTNCVLYTSLFPSNECAKLLIQAHIKAVIYFSDKYATSKETEASKRLFRRAHIKFRPYCMNSKRTGITINLKDGKSDLQKADPPTRQLPPPKQKKGHMKWGKKLFMAMAWLSAQRSKDPKTQVGACIVNEDNQIVGIGYNSMPVGCSDDDMPWEASEEDKLSDKHSYVCHAELNAVLNRNCSSLKGCRIFQTLYPCCECAKILLQSGIKEVHYLEKRPDHNTKPEFVAATRLLEKYDADGLFQVYNEQEENEDTYTESEEDVAPRTPIVMRKYTGSEDLITIDFDEIEQQPQRV